MTGTFAAGDPAVRHRGWTVRRSKGSARLFHDRDPDSNTGHEVWIHSINRPAVIFGSTQLPAGFRSPDTDDDHPGLEVCRRRSGGGVVIAKPRDVWVDAIVPRHSPLHSDDVGLAFEWLGQVWLRALRPLVARSGLDDGLLRIANPPSGRRAADRPFFCFADVGHGEVVHGDRKVVGLSQRRTRDWTRLQSLLVVDWDPGGNDVLVTDALTRTGRSDVDRSDLGAAPLRAADVAAGFRGDHPPFDVDPDTTVDAVLRCLPTVDDADRPDGPPRPAR